MKKFFLYGILIFIFSFGIGFYYSNVWQKNKEDIMQTKLSEENILKNQTTIETSQNEEKISYNASFALKKYYDECGHFTFKYSELPQELINLTKTELEELYEEWEIEEFSANSIVLSQEINNICDEHYMIKLGENSVEIYSVGNGGALDLYKETDIGKEYLTSDDLEALEKGIMVYGNGKLNSVIEDYE